MREYQATKKLLKYDMKQDIWGRRRQGDNAFKTGFQKILSTKIITYPVTFMVCQKKGTHPSMTTKRWGAKSNTLLENHSLF